MHRSSESVAAIATALAKAQTELSNPEKAMVGTVYSARSDSPQSFRYASLSSGLDIIRKALGSQQIAVAQTTDIDRANGMVNLTTTLLHTSGEWISSDWPVCQLSETSAPRRMCAALTYARRYGLFTMVGIAGEDDLDAPDVINDQPSGDKAVDSGLAPNPSVAPAPVRSNQFGSGNPNIAPVREKLDAEESAAIRAQLIQEIETLPEDEVQLRAIAILKAKNRISSLWHRSPVWCAGEVRLMLIICGSPSNAQWGARSATNSQYRCAGRIIRTTIASATKSPGGRGGLSIPSLRRGRSGFRPGASNENGASICRSAS